MYGSGVGVGHPFCSATQIRMSSISFIHRFCHIEMGMFVSPVIFYAQRTGRKGFPQLRSSKVS
ncbi:hypothetical protein ES332_A10G197800v1 [Gossypium tomentosum]|uniref:Uncharacterized protein n=1 Tax=Gossypium tomentosum TaxID=34277 RepID=A0A5D2NTY4_GOSTO|nr:hypothetical protein ES332_A10G197800v1 [Gossypium tomentosum]